MSVTRTSVVRVRTTVAPAAVSRSAARWATARLSVGLAAARRRRRRRARSRRDRGRAPRWRRTAACPPATTAAAPHGVRTRSPPSAGPSTGTTTPVGRDQAPRVGGRRGRREGGQGAVVGGRGAGRRWSSSARSRSGRRPRRPPRTRPGGAPARPPRPHQWSRTHAATASTSTGAVVSTTEQRAAEGERPGVGRPPGDLVVAHAAVGRVAHARPGSGRGRRRTGRRSGPRRPAGPAPRRPFDGERPAPERLQDRRRRVGGEGEHDLHAGGPQPPRLGPVGGAEDVEQRLLDRVLGQQRARRARPPTAGPASSCPPPAGRRRRRGSEPPDHLGHELAGLGGVLADLRRRPPAGRPSWPRPCPCRPRRWRRRGPSSARAARSRRRCRPPPACSSCEAMNSAASSSAEPPISPIIITALVSGSASNALEAVDEASCPARGRRRCRRTSSGRCPSGSARTAPGR